MGFSPGRNCNFPRISCPGLSYVRLLESVELILVNARFSPVPRVLNAAVAPNATKAASNAYSTRSWPLCCWIHLRTPANDLNMRAFIIYPPKEFSRDSIETPDARSGRQDYRGLLIREAYARCGTEGNLHRQPWVPQSTIPVHRFGRRSGRRGSADKPYSAKMKAGRGAVRKLVRLVRCLHGAERHRRIRILAYERC